MSAQPLSNVSKRGSVFRVVSGNFLEMFDFMVYGFYASAIAKAMFPSDNEFVSLMLSLMTFGVGFLMRPLGAIVLGGYIDRHGRRAGLLMSLGIMSAGVLLIALTPSYATIGLAAPVLIVVGRLLQGFSAGAESGGVSVYLAEIATPGKRGFYVSWQSASQQVAVVFAAIIGVGLRFTLSEDQMQAWGWRVPFLIGCLIVPFLFFIRRSLQETEDFKQRAATTKRPSLREVYGALARDWRIVLLAVFLVTLTSVMFYLITAYTPTFGKRELGLTDMDSFVCTVAVGIANFIWIPLMGSLSDRVGRFRVLLVFSALIALTAYPAMLWLVAEPSFGRLLATLMWFSFLYGGYQGVMVVTLTEIMPANVRATGFSLAYSLAQAIFGGFTPAISTWLIQSTGNKAMPGAWLAASAVVAVLGAVLLYRRGAFSDDLAIRASGRTRVQSRLHSSHG
ncbi:metabolite-proton symporter [Pseudoxanthomonas sp. GM95]|uniref:MFS transporter n=2 Tax=unclassified Pseudoxanthomonas TaxID=2645906 RepID=UPI0008BB3486|nr:MFS transporter [Pseudoxanthomonas sp. GM95]SEK52416.1 metabolite-proton symporter [Pseudoxanthomonas sp. GM95]